MYEEPQYIGWVFSRISEFHGIFNGEDHFFHYKTKRGFTAMKRKELTPEQIEHRRLRAQKYYQEHREYFRQMDQRYRQQHRVSISQKTIGEYCYHTIEQIQQKCPNKVERLLKQYPFEGFASRCLRRQLRYFHIYPSQARYDDCYDAGMMAYNSVGIYIISPQSAYTSLQLKLHCPDFSHPAFNTVNFLMND